MARTTLVWVKTTFVAFHRWKDAPSQVGFLRDYHRHVFHVKLQKHVTDLDREIEFIQLKARLDVHLRATYENQYFDKSCEMIAHELMTEFEASMVEVSEDGENGATVLDPSGGRIEDDPTVTKTAKTLVSKSFRTRPFVGTEAEGPFRGLRMLFVPGNCGPVTIGDACELVAKDVIDRAYYGAGNMRVFRRSSFETLATFFPKITVECDYVTTEILEAVKGNQDVLLVSLTPDDLNAHYTKKVTATEVIWQSVRSPRLQYVTQLDDPLFDQDKEI